MSHPTAVGGEATPSATPCSSFSPELRELGAEYDGEAISSDTDDDIVHRVAEGPSVPLSEDERLCTAL